MLSVSMVLITTRDLVKRGRWINSVGTNRVCHHCEFLVAFAHWTVSVENVGNPVARGNDARLTLGCAWTLATAWVHRRLSPT